MTSMTGLSMYIYGHGKERMHESVQETWSELKAKVETHRRETHCGLGAFPKFGI